MWLFTKHGFVSVVAHHDDENVLLVRMRDFETARQMDCAFHYCGEYTYDEERDYPYRIVISKELFTYWFKEYVDEMTYINFKKECESDPLYHERLFKIWSFVRRLWL